MNIFITIVLSLLSGALYRAGGTSLGTLWRDAGCPLVMLVATWVLLGWSSCFLWAFPIVYGLSWGALTTYWDFLFGYDNFYVHGFMLGIAALPLMMIVPWWAILARAVVLAASFGLINWYVNKKQVKYSDWIEELSRGIIYILTAFIFLIQF